MVLNPTQLWFWLSSEDRRLSISSALQGLEYPPVIKYMQSAVLGLGHIVQVPVIHYAGFPLISNHKAVKEFSLSQRQCFTL